MITRLFHVLGLSLLLAAPVDAQSPAQIAYQAVLSSTGGEVVSDGTYAVSFSLYALQNGGTALWTETYSSLLVEDGQILVSLGSQVPLPVSEFDQALWLGVSVDGASELSPRTALTASPYAIGLVGPVEVEAPLSLTDEATGGSTVFAVNTATSGASSGVTGATASTSFFAAGVRGVATSTSGQAAGGLFESASTSGSGVRAIATATSGSVYGVDASTESPQGAGVYGEASATSGVSSGGRFLTLSPNGRGVTGLALENEVGQSLGGYFESRSSSGIGVYGISTGSDPNLGYGLYGVATSNSGRGVLGYASSNFGITYGGNFQTISENGIGVSGWSRSTSATSGQSPIGVSGRSDSPSGFGLYGVGTATSGNNAGLYGISASPNGWGVFGANSGGGDAGRFVGDVVVTGNLSSAATSFEIDHPANPSQRVLRHLSVGSPDRMNIYNGNITTGTDGYAVVDLPRYFQSLNVNFRYQLTTIGSFSRATVSREISDGRFEVRTELPNVRVSWQVTGVRQDAWANANRVTVDEQKADAEIGRYLHPSAFGLPVDQGVTPRILESEVEPVPAAVLNVGELDR